MSSFIRKALPVYVFALIVLGLFLIPSLSDTAHAQCAVTICKSAPQLPVPQNESEATFFFFAFLQNGESGGNLAANGPCDGGAFSGSDFEITEDVPDGWTLESVECSDSALVEVTPIENGVSLDCLGGTEITCTFTNLRGPAPIPTLSEWGMITAAAGLALVGVFFAVRRRKAQAA